MTKKCLHVNAMVDYDKNTLSCCECATDVVEELREENKELRQQMQWIPVDEKLPERPLYDWVLVATKLNPENWYGVPHIAELRRNGVWYSREDELPLEELYGVVVTHWMELPNNPKDDDNNEETAKSREYLSNLEKENAEMRFILEGLMTYLRFDSSYLGLGWSKRINKVLGRK